MNIVVAKKYTESKASSVIGGVILLIFFVGLGVAITLFVYFLSLEPTAPIVIFWYVFINIISLSLGIFFCWLIIHLGNKEKTKPENTITFNEEKKSFRIATNKGYVKVPIESITKIEVENFVPISTGTVIIPIETTYGRLIFKYMSGDEKKRVVSDSIKDVEFVHSQIIGLLATYNPTFFKPKKKK